jgi:parallel beta-helix repeat protein
MKWSIIDLNKSRFLDCISKENLIDSGRHIQFMYIKSITLTAITLGLLFGVLIVRVPTRAARLSEVIRVPDDYSLMQQAIDRANPGDIIQVASGTYSESLRITKPLSLIGEGSNKTIITGSGTVLWVNADNVEIRGFTVRNGTYGIFLWFSSGALLRDNMMSGNKWNFGVWGDTLSHFVHDIDPSNRVEGQPVYFWVNQHNKHVPKDAGYVSLVSSTNITIEDVAPASNEQGILLVETRDSLVKNVTVSGNDEGIVLRRSTNNTIRLNTLISINWHGLYLVSSHGNTVFENTIRNGTYGMLTQDSAGNRIYHNNFIDNKVQLYQGNSSNSWDNGGEGNYWSDYVGSDSDGDGVGDTGLPHLGVDYYPLASVFDKMPPVAEAGKSRTVFRDTEVVFDGGNSVDNVGIIDYKWFFGDGSNGTGKVVNHSYRARGTYTVKLTVIDPSGNTATDVALITVTDPPVSFEWQILFVLLALAAIAAVAISWWRRSTRSEKQSIKEMLHRVHHEAQSKTTGAGI